MAEPYLLQVKNLKIDLKVDKNFIPVVVGVDLNLEPGKVLGLVGESGCGKSVIALSLLRLLAKELKIVDGEILFYKQNGDAVVDIAKQGCQNHQQGDSRNQDNPNQCIKLYGGK